MQLLRRRAGLAPAHRCSGTGYFATVWTNYQATLGNAVSFSSRLGCCFCGCGERRAYFGTSAGVLLQRMGAYHTP